ncbi:WD40-repeat-containing domain protein [Lipomyces oligophaga]|uniref:WD40-repeat-containing domain protein n=1 Tax=Lipomyces oligophaga TaxID=45792 RepID=UPI0034CE3DC5
MPISRESLWAALPSTASGVAVHFSYDARSDRLVYASNRSIHLRSLSKPEISSQYTAHVANTSVAKFAPSGYYVASADVSGQVKVFDSSAPIDQDPDPSIIKADIPVISGRINDLAWDADSKRIIAVGDGKERFGHCFTFDTGNSVGEITGHGAVVNAVAIRPVRPYRAATVADDYSLVWYTGPPYKFVKAIRGNHSNFVTDVCFLVDGSYAVSVGLDRKLVIYDGREGDVVLKVDDAHSGGILAVAPALGSTGPAGFATASSDGSVKLWKIVDGKVESVLQWSSVANGGNLVGITFTSEKSLAAIALTGDIIYLSLDSAEPVRTIYGHQRAITAVHVSNDKSVIYTGSYDGRIVAWNAATGESSLVSGAGSNLVTGIIELDHAIFSAGWDDNLRLIASDNDSAVTLESQPKGIATASGFIVLATESKVMLYDPSGLSCKTSYTTASSSISVSSASGSLVAIGLLSGGIELLSLPELKPLAKPAIAPARAAVSAISISPAADLLAVGDSAGKIILYSLGDGSVVTTRWAFHTARVTSISWHPDGRYVVTSGLDTNLYVYSVDKPAKNLKVLGAHKDGVNAVTWLGDSKIISVGADACVKIWSVEQLA